MTTPLRTRPAPFLRRTADAVLRLVPIMAAVSMALWPKQAPTLVFGLLAICIALCVASTIARRADRRTHA